MVPHNTSSKYDDLAFTPNVHSKKSALIRHNTQAKGGAFGLQYGDCLCKTSGEGTHAKTWMQMLKDGTLSILGAYDGAYSGTTSSSMPVESTYTGDGRINLALLNGMPRYADREGDDNWLPPKAVLPDALRNVPVSISSYEASKGDSGVSAEAAYSEPKSRMPMVSYGDLMIRGSERDRYDQHVY
jgi:hypothetical protein